MNSNVEFRALAWKRLWADHWFGRLFGGGLLLWLCGYAVQGVLSNILGGLGVQSWFDYLDAVVRNRQDLTTPIPNLTHEFVSNASSATVLTMFLSFIMTGIALYGCAVILKKCLANDEKGWLAEAFGGFKFPFGMLWLQLRYWLIWLGWSLVAFCVPGILCGAGYRLVKNLPLQQLALVAGIVVMLGLCWAIWILCIPFYRYRFLWLVKAEHPDWSAGECIGACRKLMKGNLRRSFRLDCSYWKPITLMLLPLVVLSVTILANEWHFGEGKQGLSIISLVGFPCMIVFLSLAIVVPQYVSVGQGFLYEEIKEQKDQK